MSLHLEDIIIAPRITEKTQACTDGHNRYVLTVNKSANKFQIRDAVEKLFDVKVLNIKTAIMPGKLKRSGKTFKKTPSFKKAYVQLKEGQKLEFFKGI